MTSSSILAGDLTIGGTEGIPRSDLTCGEVTSLVGVWGGAASYSQNNSVIGIFILLKGGATLCGRNPSQCHVVELKRWLKCRGATTAGRKEDLVKRLAKCMYFIKDIEPNYNF